MTKKDHAHGAKRDGPGEKEECPEGDCKAEPSEAAAEQVTLSAGDYESLRDKVAEAEALKEQLLRSAADFDNAKKRLSKEREEFVKFGQENLIRGMLPVLDNFHRVLDHAGEDSGEKNLKSLVTGVQRIFKQMQDGLQSQGLRKIDAAGQKFDPHRHEAVGYVHEEGEEDVVVDELEAGYELHGRLLRPAKVRVRMHPPSDGPSGAQSGEKQDEIT
ncbi:MAG: nucleotide exchange factor GrpE [Candidatus Omnitrophota bacterium]|jgi:molecular chaperone GrpE